MSGEGTRHYTVSPTGYLTKESDNDISGFTGLFVHKCGNPQFEADEIRTTGKIARLMNIQHKKFAAIVCAIPATPCSIDAASTDWPTCWTSWQANHDRGRTT